MAIARLDRPAIFVYGGTIRPGAKRRDIVSVFEAVGGHARGNVSDDQLLEVERTAIPGPGSCGGMYTANTMASAIEALGLSLPNSSAQEAVSDSKDDDCQGQWAVLADPDGAAFGIIPVVPDESDTAEQDVRQGCISWLSLAVPNASSSRDFYQQVIGWNAKSVESEELVAKFEMQIDNETAATEILQFGSKQSEIPSIWLIHLPVDDFVESLRCVSEGGGEVIEEFPEARCAVVRDPVGVYLALQAG